jgi:hypothetical protein
MAKSVEENLGNRINEGFPTGRKQVILNTLADSVLVKGIVAKAGADRNRTAVGNVNEVFAPFLKTTGYRALVKSKATLAYGQKVLDQQKAFLRTKAAGKALPTDAEWRDVIRKMPAGERPAFLLNNPAARGPALRERELAFISQDVYEHVMNRELRENHERDLAILEIAEEAQELHRASVGVLEQAILSVPAVVEENGAVRPFVGPLELSKYLDKELPGQQGREATFMEQSVLDGIGLAA